MKNKLVWDNGIGYLNGVVVASVGYSLAKDAYSTWFFSTDNPPEYAATIYFDSLEEAIEAVDRMYDGDPAQAGVHIQALAALERV